MCSRVSKATEQHKSTTRSAGIYAGTRSVIYPSKIITTQNRINKAGDSRADMSLCSHFKRVFFKLNSLFKRFILQSARRDT